MSDTNAKEWPWTIAKKDASTTDWRSRTFSASGKREIAIGARFGLKLHYICTGGDKATANVEAEAMWHHKEDNMPYREVGFRFINVNADTRACIERILDDLDARAASGP